MFALRPLRRYQVITDLSVAGVFALIMLAAELSNGVSAVDDLGAVLLVVAMSAALAMRRLNPGTALALAWAGALLQMAFTRSPSPSDIAIFAVLYTTAAYGSRRVFWAGFASSLVGAVVIVGSVAAVVRTETG